MVWEIAAGRFIDPFWFSSPLRIVTHLIQWTREGALFGHLMVTLRETFLGYLLGSAAGILTFFITFYATFSGLRAVKPAYKEIARVVGASERQIFLKMNLPAASPWIVFALKVGVPFSLIGAIIGEFMAASRGLGYMIQFNTNQFDTTGAASEVLVLMVCVMLFNGAVNRLECYVLRWRPRAPAAPARELG
ncbi:MAG: ABC transporter permease subunit [Candidatus Rokubacteria bacterium]|nr:ABC transporter permease subunit [Candidatus Rokubacteria bacterium]